jgi:GNAT superfamily N-acetyltransferase
MPLPLWFKKLHGTVRRRVARMNQQPPPPPYDKDDDDDGRLMQEDQSLQGWITNLLVAPEHRARGYSKWLVTACEVVATQQQQEQHPARNWNCTSIHLHCDAHPRDGRVAQNLYRSMGYRELQQPPPQSRKQKQELFTWANNSAATTQSSSVFVIDDVPLLYLYKNLKTKEEN